MTRTILGLVTPFFLLTLAGCAAEPESGRAAGSLPPTPLSTPSPTPSETVTDADCTLPVVFKGRTYRMLLLGDTPVERGGRVGEGTFGPCSGSEVEGAPAPREVFGLKDVPPAQAIVLTDAEGGSATVFVAEDLAEPARDPELAALLARGETWREH